MFEHLQNLSELFKTNLLCTHLSMESDDLFVVILRWPVRTISFNHTGEYIASASEDLFIDIVSTSQSFVLCSGVGPTFKIF